MFLKNRTLFVLRSIRTYIMTYLKLTIMEAKEKLPRELLEKTAQQKEAEHKYGEAIELYQTLLAEDDNSFELYSRLGFIYEKVRDYINAKEVYKRALAKARQFHEKTWERDFSYTLLGLVD